jgi:hypothetical protein
MSVGKSLSELIQNRKIQQNIQRIKMERSNPESVRKFASNLSFDESIPVRSPSKPNVTNMRYSLLGEEDPIARGTVTPPERFGISKKAYDENFENNPLSPFAEGSELERRFIESQNDSFTLGIRKNNLGALERANERILEAQETGSVVGLLRRQNELYNQSSRSGSVPQAGTPQGLEYGLLGNQIDIMERNAAKSDFFSTNPEAQQASRRLFSGDAYDEAVHMRNNTATSTNAMNGGTSGPTPPSSSNIPIDPARTPTGSTSYSGYYQPGETPSSSGLLGSMSQDGAAGVMSSMAFGAAIGGVTNYAMGGEFGEGAMMGGLAGGAIKVGARAIQQNQSSIEGFLQRTALGDAGQNMTRDQAAKAIQGMQTAGENAGLMQRGAFNILKSENPSLGMQSRYMVMGGSALSGVMFTGSRKDKRRGFNAHRGNRI